MQLQFTLALHSPIGILLPKTEGTEICSTGAEERKRPCKGRYGVIFSWANKLAGVIRNRIRARKDPSASRECVALMTLGQQRVANFLF